MRDPEFALEERSIQILTDPYKSILVSGILPQGLVCWYGWKSYVLILVLITSNFISLKPGITALTSEDIIREYSLIKDWRRGLLSFDERINREIKTAGEMLFLASGFRWRRFWHPLGKFAVSAGDQLCNNQLQSLVNFLSPLLALWGFGVIRIGFPEWKWKVGKFSEQKWFKGMQMVQIKWPWHWKHSVSSNF